MPLKNSIKEIMKFYTKITDWAYNIECNKVPSSV